MCVCDGKETGRTVVELLGERTEREIIEKGK